MLLFRTITNVWLWATAVPPVRRTAVAAPASSLDGARSQRGALLPAQVRPEPVKPKPSLSADAASIDFLVEHLGSGSGSLGAQLARTVIDALLRYPGLRGHVQLAPCDRVRFLLLRDVDPAKIGGLVAAVSKANTCLGPHPGWTSTLARHTASGEWAIALKMPQAFWPHTDYQQVLQSEPDAQGLAAPPSNTGSAPLVLEKGPPTFPRPLLTSNARNLLELFLLSRGPERHISPLSSDSAEHAKMIWTKAWTRWTSDALRVMALTPTAWEARQLLPELAYRCAREKEDRRDVTHSMTVCNSSETPGLLDAMHNIRRQRLPRSAAEEHAYFAAMQAWATSAQAKTTPTLVHLDMEAAKSCRPEFFAALRQFADVNKIAIVADEICEGVAPRDNEPFFAHVHTGLRPDFVLFGGTHIGLYGLSASKSPKALFASTRSRGFEMPTRVYGPVLDLMRSIRILDHESIDPDAAGQNPYLSRQRPRFTGFGGGRIDLMNDYGLRALPVDPFFCDASYTKLLVTELSAELNENSKARHGIAWHEAWQALAPQASLVAAAATGSEANGLSDSIAAVAAQHRLGLDPSVPVQARVAFFAGAWGATPGRSHLKTKDIDALWVDATRFS